MHYYKRNIGDYSTKAGHLSALEHGVYTLLLDSYYNRERGPTKAEAIRWARARTADELAAVDAVLAEFFTEADGVYVQSRVEQELSTYRANAQTNRRIAVERESTKRARNVGGSLQDREPNHKPLTTNQEPEEKAKDSCASPLGGAPPTGPQKSDPIPYQAIADLYNKTMSGLPKLREMTTKRKTLIRSAWSASKARQDLRFWGAYFDVCAGEGFLNGSGPYREPHANWRPDFDYLLKTDVVTRVFERAMDAMERAKC
jgi:uncharacterized protein YdaU (DUF1376 family)